MERLLLISGSEVGKRIAEHASLVDAAIAAGTGHLAYIARGDARSDSHDLARLIRREPTPLR